MASGSAGSWRKQVITLLHQYFLRSFYASLVAIPVSWFVAHKWLQGFVPCFNKSDDLYFESGWFINDHIYDGELRDMEICQSKPG
jgi:hypothetical protein